jgi:hypothetical protein
MSNRVLGFKKVPATDPQKFQLFTKDNENMQPGYEGTTDFGTEEEIREALTLGGMSALEIDLLIDSAK